MSAFPRDCSLCAQLQVDHVSAYYEVIRKIQSCTADTHPGRARLDEVLQHWGRLLRGERSRAVCPWSVTRVR